ncbi:hypothetical protein [Acinetobacter bereziniae]|uniref:hypothetical protein n=1 Tax=Acinetobacter bereziniae TaxID=106648 RepID=UPI0018DCBFB5|nr:hypothetical protein [Acinetobacter bereziniae]MBI0393213.1 hypothetical protein [Acinetobacter bereziniae]
MKNIIIFISSMLSILLAQMSHATLSKIPEETQIEIFKSAKFKKTNLGWESRCSLGNISYYGDLNKDGRPDAIVVDGGIGCYADTGIGFYIVTQQIDRKWVRIFNSRGQPEFLSTLGRHGWPDIAINDGSKCFNVYKWNGQKFEKDRLEYKNKACSSPTVQK